MAGYVQKVKEGSYRLRFKDYSRYVTAKSDHAAETLLAKFVTEVESGNFSKPSKVTFGEFVKGWLENYGEPVLAPKTLHRYKGMLETRILPAFGTKNMEKIKPLELLAFYNSLKGKHEFMKVSKDRISNPTLPNSCEREKGISSGLSDQTVKHHHRLISAIFEKAIKWNVYQGKNPANFVDAPKVERKKAKFYDLDQIAAMLQALEKEDLHHKAVVMIALTTGARLGEVMGLEWQDVDHLNKTIEIRQSSQYIPRIGTFTKDPKNESSKRRLSVNNALLSILKAYKEDQQSRGFLCGDSNRLFINWKGEPMNPSTLAVWFPKFLGKNELPRITFHSLRHTSATFLIGQGMDIETIARRLGHTTSVTTQSVYSHFLKAKDRQAADMMEETFKPAAEKKAKKA